MLSSEIPPGSSSPSNTLTDGERQTPSFSIRDYVFTARSKDIATNWPFPQQFLQLCLNRGVGDVLPPFEPPDSVRAYSCCKKVESDQPVACSGGENILEQFESLEIGDVAPVDEELCDVNLGCSDQALYSLPEKNKQVDTEDISDDETSEDNAEAVSVVTSNDQIERIRDRISEIPCSLEATQRVSDSSSKLAAANHCQVPSELEKLRHPSEKKCRLIVKFSAAIETGRAEDIASTSSTVSDSMASKVCPVCKIFTSTSNTTLNAHIDQCLSTDCNIKLAETGTPKPKLKPAKKRLMADIYTTARRCTLEDLDRRNGTNWVNSGLNLRLNLMAPTTEVCTENKKAKMSPVDAVNDEIPADGRENGNEGAVYVDSNGIKLRILSKFNDTPPSVSREQFKLKERVKNIKEDKSLSLNKKSRFTLKHSMYMKAKPQIKKLSTYNLFKGEIQAASEADLNADTDQENEDSPLEISSTPGHIKTSDSLSVKHWVCSKRSVLRKRLNLNDIHNLGKPVLRPRKPLPQNKQPDVSNSSIVKRNVKFSRSPENMTSSPKTKRVDFLLNTFQIMDKGKCAKPSTISSKCSSENASRSGTISEETDTVGQSDNSYDNLEPSTASHSSVKATRSSTMQKDVLFDKQSRDDLTEKIFINLKFRKHRSSLRTGRKMPYNNVGVMRRTIKHCSLDARRTSNALDTRCSKRSELISRSSTEETTDQESPSSSNISESEDEEEGGIRTIDRHPDVDCCDLEMATSGMHVTYSGSAATVSKSSSERGFSDSLSYDALIPTNGSLSSSAKLDPKQPVDENAQSFHKTDVHFEVPADKFMYDEAVGKCSQDADESRFRPNADSRSTRYTECQAEAASVQVSSACLTSHDNTMPEIPHDNSSVTSVKITSDQDLNLAIDMDPTGSPISTTSTISPSARGSKEEPSMKSTIQGESGSTMPCRESIFSAERTNREFIRSALPQLKKPEQFPGDQSYCCCSRIPKDPQFFRESIMEGMVMPSKGKQISSYCTASGLNSDTIGSPSVEQKALNPTAKAPASADFRSPSPSPRTRTNSILRLMGKNLMVSSNEESEQPALVYQSAPDNLNTGRLPPIIVGASGWENFPYYHQLPENFAASGMNQTMGNQQLTLQSPSVQAGGYASHQHAEFTTKQAYFNHPPVCYTNRMATNSANIPTDIPRSNLMSPGQFLPSGVSSCFRPYSSACPRGHASNMMRGRTLDGSDLAPRPQLVFQPQTNQPWPSLYYSPTLR